MFVVVGSPGSERVDGFQAALARRGLPPARVIPWEDVLAGREIPFGRLRLESPGENPVVERLLLARGAELPDERFDTPRLGRRACLALAEDPGRVLFPRQFYLGFRDLLRRLPPAMNPPEQIAAILDKPTAHERMSGVPRPEVIGTPASFDELQALRPRRVFVKLANGSSASGVVAYQTDGRRHLATTSAEIAGDRLYNSKRVRRYGTLAEVRVLFDLLCREGVIVERWIPKASLDGQAFDLRVLVVAGRARHVVVRRSRGPITNLHLGNRRGEVEAVRAFAGEDAWRAALEAAERAVAAFPGCLYAGVDVLLSSRARRPFIAEVNAFGDLLRRVDTYGAELEAVA